MEVANAVDIKTRKEYAHAQCVGEIFCFYFYFVCQQNKIGSSEKRDSQLREIPLSDGPVGKTLGAT